MSVSDGDGFTCEDSLNEGNKQKELCMPVVPSVPSQEESDTSSTDRHGYTTKSSPVLTRSPPLLFSVTDGFNDHKHDSISLLSDEIITMEWLFAIAFISSFDGCRFGLIPQTIAQTIGNIVLDDDSKTIGFMIDTIMLLFMIVVIIFVTYSKLHEKLKHRVNAESTSVQKPTATHHVYDDLPAPVAMLYRKKC